MRILHHLLNVLVACSIVAMPALPKAAHARAQAPNPPVAGKVTGDNGGPLAGAGVWLVNASVSVATKSSSEVIASTKTDSAGRFHLTIPDRWFEAAHSWRADLGVVAHLPGRRPAMAPA